MSGKTNLNPGKHSGSLPTKSDVENIGVCSGGGRGRYPTDPQYKVWLQSSRWRTLRMQHLSDRPWCEECLQHHRRTLATEVHHRQPVLSLPTRTEREFMMFNPHNLQSLCHACHMAKHSRREQQAHQQERQQSHRQAFIEKYKSPHPPQGGVR